MLYECLTFSHYCKPNISIQQKNLVISNRRICQKSFHHIYLSYYPTSLSKKKKNFICAPFCLRLIFMLRMHCWRKYSLIFSVPDTICNMSKRTTFMGILVFPSKIFLELSNFLMLKMQLCQKAPFHAATVDISLIELCGL